MISKKIIYLFVITAILAIVYSILIKDSDLTAKIIGISLFIGFIIICYIIPGPKETEDDENEEDDTEFWLLYLLFFFDDNNSNNRRER